MTGKAASNVTGKFRAADIKIPLNDRDKETDISEYIQRHANEVVTFERIGMKTERPYNSYKLFVPENKLNTFLDDNLWPEGIAFRRLIHFKKQIDNTILNENAANNNGYKNYKHYCCNFQLNYAVDTSAGRRRSFVIVEKVGFLKGFSVVGNSDRITAIKTKHADGSLFVFSVYMPTVSGNNLIEFTACLSEIIAISENSGTESVYVVGDINAHPGERFANGLSTVCVEQTWSCIDLELLPADTYMFKSTANGALRYETLSNEGNCFDDVYSSDHIPLIIECNISLIIP
ncbi:unnamed protein product [Leptidea sinapis]|uniref:Endonuclease/exonuclease/phosphatase domain-containing protein n=1 Tax=Leptidea sinapis TaxID=189913 RepID=A0A5E4PRS9_9NEOP|nr:unnamed protein product [Leptidea sinapis]